VLSHSIAFHYKLLNRT